MYNVNGFYNINGKDHDFDRSFKTYQSALNYFTKIRDEVEWDSLALNMEDEKEILAWELGRDGKLITA